MKRLIDLKHIGPRGHVRQLVDELCDRLEERIHYVDAEAVSVHVVFEENGTHKLYRASVTCHLPHVLVVAHEEGRDAGAALRDAFQELQHQVEKHHPIRRRKLMQKRSPKRQPLTRAMDALEE